MDCELRLPDGFERLVHTAIAEQSDLRADRYLPECAEVAEALQTALWASLLREEGQPLAFALSLHPARLHSLLIPLRNPVPFNASTLAKISMATTPDVSAVHVGPGADGLLIYGIDMLSDDVLSVRIEVRGPAVVAVKVGRTTVAFVSGNNAELIDNEIYGGYFAVNSPLPAGEDPHSDRERRLLDLARAMHRHDHGGTLLVLGAKAEEFDAERLAAALEPHYLLSRPFDGLREIEEQEGAILARLQTETAGAEARALFSQLRATEALHSRYVSSVARCTALDGATVVSSEGALLAFGCKVRLTNTPSIRLKRPTLAVATRVELADFGGTRHQSAARFVGRHPGSRAIVRSQDGFVSILRHAQFEAIDCLEHAEWLF